MKKSIKQKMIIPLAVASVLPWSAPSFAKSSRAVKSARSSTAPAARMISAREFGELTQPQKIRYLRQLRAMVVELSITSARTKSYFTAEIENPSNDAIYAMLLQTLFSTEAQAADEPAMQFNFVPTVGPGDTAKLEREIRKLGTNLALQWSVAMKGSPTFFEQTIVRLARESKVDPTKVVATVSEKLLSAGVDPKELNQFMPQIPQPSHSLRWVSTAVKRETSAQQDVASAEQTSTTLPEKLQAPEPPPFNRPVDFGKCEQATEPEKEEIYARMNSNELNKDCIFGGNFSQYGAVAKKGGCSPASPKDLYSIIGGEFKCNESKGMLHCSPFAFGMFENKGFGITPLCVTKNAPRETPNQTFSERCQAKAEEIKADPDLGFKNLLRIKDRDPIAFATAWNNYAKGFNNVCAEPDKRKMFCSECEIIISRLQEMECNAIGACPDNSTLRLQETLPATQ